MTRSARSQSVNDVTRSLFVSLVWHRGALIRQGPCFVWIPLQVSPPCQLQNNLSLRSALLRTAPHNPSESVEFFRGLWRAALTATAEGRKQKCLTL